MTDADFHDLNEAIDYSVMLAIQFGGDQGAELLHRIVSNPLDVGPRLMYADWLMDRGEEGDWERGELIQQQFGDGEDQTEYKRCQKIVRATIDDLLPVSYKLELGVSKAWNMDAPRRFAMLDVELPFVGCVVIHGFIESIALNQGLFIREGFAKALFERHPIREVVLTRQAPESALGSPHVAWLRDGVAVGSWPRNMVASAIWDRLRLGAIINPNQHTTLKCYASEEEAFSDLSTACCLWGRELAGLPELNPQPVEDFSRESTERIWRGVEQNWLPALPGRIIRGH